MKHDEAKDVRLLSKIAKINSVMKTIIIQDNAIIGNRRWGRIDFLTHYCGYHLVKQDKTIMSNSPNAEEKRKRKDKKEKREEKAQKRKQDKTARR